jgi:hypothetical protein
MELGRCEKNSTRACFRGHAFGCADRLECFFSASLASCVGALGQSTAIMDRHRDRRDGASWERFLVLLNGPISGRTSQGIIIGALFGPRDYELCLRQPRR